MNRRRSFQWLVLFAAIIVLALIIVFVRQRIIAQQNHPAPTKIANPQYPDVSVMTVTSGKYAANVVGYGTATPHYELTLTAQVSGQVKSLAPQLESGHRVKKGDLLVHLEDSEYKAALASAEQDLSEARLSFLEEERQAEQALKEWQASGMPGSPDSELVLRQPQLAAAKAAVANAEAAVASALHNLHQTRITAPFAALIVERSIAPGSYLQEGGEIAVLYSTERVEIPVSLSAKDWRKLPDQKVLDSGTLSVVLNNVESGKTWTGQILRSEQHLDTTTRKRTLIISVEHPLDQTPALLPATFIQATIPGRQLDQLWKLPSSALSQKGQIWYIKEDNTLASFSATPVFSDSEAIYIATPEKLTDRPRQVLVHPLSSYLAGMIVNPIEESSHE